MATFASRQHTEELRSKIAACDVSLIVVPENEGDAKLWMEIGASICLDKPLLLVTHRGRIPARKLQEVADAVVTVDKMADEGEKIMKAIKEASRRHSHPVRSKPDWPQ